ncbi:GNAT family N-acetyltransferase [Culicoidibacter larvae]|nr:N-acetyltransferase [Culicoidibacter larvae]
MFDIVHEKESHRVIAKKDTQVLATLIYELTDNNIVILHTILENEADEDYARDLILLVVDYARRNNYKVIPASPLAAKVFKKDADLLADVRAVIEEK